MTMMRYARSRWNDADVNDGVYHRKSANFCLHSFRRSFLHVVVPKAAAAAAAAAFCSPYSRAFLTTCFCSSYATRGRSSNSNSNSNISLFTTVVNRSDTHLSGIDMCSLLCECVCTRVCTFLFWHAKAPLEWERERATGMQAFQQRCQTSQCTRRIENSCK